MGNRYVVVDLETTGNSPKNGDKIIQFGACVVENGKIIEQFSSHVNPEREISPFIEEFTGITNEKVASAPLFREIAPKIMTMLQDAYFVAHNVRFDLSFLQAELREAGFDGFYGPVLDTVELARILLPTADSYKLQELAESSGLSHVRPHQADSDAYVTAELLIQFINRLLAMPRVTLLQLLKLSKHLKNDLALFIEELLQKKDKSHDELPKTLEIHRGIALKKPMDDMRFLYDRAEREQLYPDSDDEKEQLFLTGLPEYEKRSGQFLMMDVIYSSFADGQHALIEAGTGVGKSLAYLLPAAFFAKENGETVVISTYTIQLQEQLIQNDLPRLQKIFPFPVQAVLLKGKNNYLSLAKFEHSLADNEQNYDTVLTKMQILVWLLETETGDFDELHLSSGGVRFWEEISHDHFSREMHQSWRGYDFYERARKKARHAELIITNHSFLLADLRSNDAILPDYQYCVIDEAHHFDKEASRFFGDALGYLSIRMLIQQFGQYEQMLLYGRLDNLLKKRFPERYKELSHPFAVNQLYEDLLWETEEFFHYLIAFAKKTARNQSHYKIAGRLSKQDHPAEWNMIRESALRLSFLLKDLHGFLEKNLSMLREKDENYTEQEKKLILEIVLYLQKVDDYHKKLQNIIVTPPEMEVVWIETDERAPHNTTTIYSRPVSVSRHLQEQFFSQKNSVVLTSATLTVKDSFQYFVRELGLEKTPCRFLQIPSPFRYKNQVQLIIPNDLPELNTVSFDDYVSAIAGHIISVAEATKGRMLILFTSHEMLRETYSLIKESGFLENFAMIAQGITSGSRSRLIRNFRQFERAILFGTNSFWEGIDIPGEDLSCLVIVRLPFSPPSEPFTEAKCELISSTGGNAFLDYSLPEAVIRFKQGFGRLIRTGNDRGVVFVFDRRIVTTSYGRAFLESIPDVPVTELDINRAVDFVENWLNEEK